MKNQFEGLTVSCVVGMLVLAAGLQGQQPQKLQGGQPSASQAQGQPQLLEIYQIDLEPSGSAFALGKPKLEGDVYVFPVWPEKDIVRLPKARVKKITQRTKDLNKEVAYRIDLVPSGNMLARDQPKLQGGAYVFHLYKDGALMSLRKSDVQKVTQLTGIPAFKAQQEAKGVALIDNLPMQGGGSTTILPGPEAVTVPQGQTPAPGNWTYEGVPGTSDAYGPANATVASPGDVPKAPEPAPTQPPR